MYVTIQVDRLKAEGFFGMMAIFFDPYSGLIKRILLPQNKGIDFKCAEGFLTDKSNAKFIFVSQLIQQIEKYFQGAPVRFCEEMFDLS